MLNSLKDILEILPFVVMVNGRPQLNFSRVLEALVIGAAVGVFMAYVGLKVLEVKFDNLTTEIKELKTEVIKIKDDIYRPVITNDNGAHK